MPSLPSRCAAAFLLGGLLLPFAGCGRTMTEDDCRRVGEGLQRAWREEAQKATPTDGPAATKAAGVLRAEEERLADDWATECKRDLIGKRIEPKELECLQAAKSLEQIGKCSER
ncbi:MAG TPA: hypothetical protein VLS89_20995 [Candidatus Nanopelagicales bacterium]|nr:hypothetical protein [Candidatus Nanopelagicales bacterium]